MHEQVNVIDDDVKTDKKDDVTIECVKSELPVEVDGVIKDSVWIKSTLNDDAIPENLGQGNNWGIKR
ncbi:hypothetical protein C9925_01660 [cyanobacterium G8-9]|nr:hypothetical protein C9925_01660 [cyanobacterium G8-9]